MSVSKQKRQAYEIDNTECGGKEEKKMRFLLIFDPQNTFLVSSLFSHSHTKWEYDAVFFKDTQRRFSIV